MSTAASTVISTIPTPTKKLTIPSPSILFSIPSSYAPSVFSAPVTPRRKIEISPTLDLLQQPFFSTRSSRTRRSTRTIPTLSTLPSISSPSTTTVPPSINDDKTTPRNLPSGTTSPTNDTGSPPKGILKKTKGGTSVQWSLPSTAGFLPTGEISINGGTSGDQSMKDFSLIVPSTSNLDGQSDTDIPVESGKKRVRRKIAIPFETNSDGSVILHRPKRNDTSLSGITIPSLGSDIKVDDFPTTCKSSLRTDQQPKSSPTRIKRKVSFPELPVATESEDDNPAEFPIDVATVSNYHPISQLASKGVTVPVPIPYHRVPTNSPRTETFDTNTSPNLPINTNGETGVGKVTQDDDDAETDEIWVPDWVASCSPKTQIRVEETMKTWIKNQRSKGTKASAFACVLGDLIETNLPGGLTQAEINDCTRAYGESMKYDPIPKSSYSDRSTNFMGGTAQTKVKTDKALFRHRFLGDAVTLHRVFSQYQNEEDDQDDESTQHQTQTQGMESTNQNVTSDNLDLNTDKSKSKANDMTNFIESKQAKKLFDLPEWSKAQSYQTDILNKFETTKRSFTNKDRETLGLLSGTIVDITLKDDEEAFGKLCQSAKDLERRPFHLDEIDPWYIPGRSFETFSLGEPMTKTLTKRGSRVIEK
ncbi:hypothetical protein TREMEDRAFT_65136 [Tremella mesenterica DSM 1558]|uniref:uncharacterized protein n=1 Tax=Tremella mesenterica (strain ATCC 24925 / CBS 8224 / DSM 1558 / NBRC 9311 / NRRL Y-6157 / RJB 2259-6 / UBC 559-6) TaxID=578456 RepID=UPI00032CB8CD|nr:uncharacterized protein TREMEDRAFT_65136 [Tremella mesenterica DSM 1558]EIW66737.1 hypothetical protein TREMEDRAFT_65136 [Tremella mesenterica DSM 1558]